MKFNECEEKLNWIKELAKKSSTGTPKQLAARINVSERTVFRLIQTIKDQDINIEFCRKLNSYFINNF